jgi:hypothetical protein
MGKGEIGMRRAFGKTVLSIVVFFLIFCMIGAPNASIESVTSSSSSGADSKGPRMDHLQIKFYENESAEFQGLLNDEIDFMDSPLTMDQYQSVLGNPDVEVAPYYDFAWYEMAFNNNATDPSHTQYRKALNYTEFRQAMACLIDKDGLIAGPDLNGFATRIDTPMPRPVFDNWVDFNVSKYDSNGKLLNNYPWDFNETHALEILWNNGWYSHTFYPTFVSLQAAYPLTAAIGTDRGVVYPPGHPKTGQPIDTVIGYTRSDSSPRKTAGIAFATEMAKLGMNVTNSFLKGSAEYITGNRDYDFYTAGWGSDLFGRFPTYFYVTYTPVGIGSFNFYMISDGDLAYHATMEYPNATTAAQSMNEALTCQDIIVKQAMTVALYSLRFFYAYRKGWLGVANTQGGYATVGYGSYGSWGLRNALDYLMLNVQHENYPRVNTIRLGTVSSPSQINPIFFDRAPSSRGYEVVDRMFTCPISMNPYEPTYLGKSPQGGDMPWMVYDWKYEQGSDGNAIVTLWFNHHIKWQDGVPFTVDDFNYTICLNQAYDDSNGYGDFIHVRSFEKIDDWTCKLYFDFPSIYALYAVNYNIVPKHIYEHVDVPVPNDYTTGHHGEWPGKDAIDAQVHAPLNCTELQLDGDQVWVGTGMWKYHPSTYVSGAGGGIMFDANRDFFLDTPPPGEMDFTYRWIGLGLPPQGGSYKVDLSDLVMLANAYGSMGNPPSPNWNLACDVAAPSGIIGLSDLVTLARDYGREWGNYTVATPPT